mgnify:FL=1
MGDENEEKLQRNIQKSKEEIAEKSSKLKELKVEWVPRDSLKPNWYNPNRQSDYEFELLCKSMEEDGFTQPIIALKSDRPIVDGEHRWRASEVLGHTEVPVVFVDMPVEQMMVSTLRHNRARGSEDGELVLKVMQELKELGAHDWAKDSLVLNDEEMSRLYEKMNWVTGEAGQIKEEFEVRKVKDMSEVSSSEGGAVVYVTEDEQGREVVTAMSKEAADKMREFDNKRRQAESKEFDDAVIEKKNWVVFSFAYSNEEAKIVKAVLGNKAAEVIVELCKEELAENGDKYVAG